jgi:hypothetical protein
MLIVDPSKPLAAHLGVRAGMSVAELFSLVKKQNLG